MEPQGTRAENSPRHHNLSQEQPSLPQLRKTIVNLKMTPRTTPENGHNTKTPHTIVATTNNVYHTL